MKTIVLCTKCKAELCITDVRPAHAINEVEISVEICQNSDCYEGEQNEIDCSDCLDLKIWQKRAEEAEVKLRNIRMFLDGGIDGAKPAQPDKFDSHKPDNEKAPKVNILQPTEDVVSTGGAIIPGIKEGSAKGAKAEY